jgi:hypothetical protein
MCLAFETTGDTEADAFGFCNYEDGCNGQARIYEYVVYTNELTAAERLETEEYLMRKWMSAHANYDRLGDVQDRLSSFDVALAPALSVREGDLCAIDVVTGNGSLVKKGKGTLYVEDLASGETSIEVREGLFNLRSVKTSADTLPAKPWVHFDASDASSLVFAADGNAGTVTEMRDRRGEGHPKAVMKSGSAVELKSTAAVGGLGMLDFGPYYSESADRKSMRFELNGNGAYNEKLRTTVSVVGTRHGGGVLVGGSSARGSNVSYHDLDGLYRQNPGTYSSPIVSSFNRPSPGMFSSEHPGAARTRLNGEFVVPAKTGFSGGYDLVSLAVYDFFGASGIACCHYGAAVGALEFGEQILFEETLSREQILNVEAYLRRKWFGADEPAYRGSRAKSLVVDKDAVMNIYGDSPLEVSSLSGEGIVNGPLRLADGGELLVEILEDGAVRAPSMSGFNPLAGGKLRISDPGKTIRLGRETMILSGLAAADRVLDNWSAITSRRNGGARFRIEGGKLLMTLLPRGLRIFVR